MGKGTQIQLVSASRASQLPCSLRWECFVENCLHGPFFYVAFQCVVNFYTGRVRSDTTFSIFLQQSIPQHRGQHLAGQLQALYLWLGKSDTFHGHCLLLMQLCISDTQTLCRKKFNTSHSGFKIINIWLKQIGLDGHKPREEFHAKCTQNFGLLLYIVTWELIQFKKVILSDAENINFIVTWTSF